ncbi:hypothetical protein [Saccharospirillum sp. MSK14-1]|uniref:hypothetical protein n=1 Tax=Saccharospirillum sp. MSK14-1 TaxID=1897632 RepID=UPI0011B297EE|nr:hypothetical protein [Saccharospirillum sp. MSK14-1]
MTVQGESPRSCKKSSHQVFRRSLLALSIAATFNTASAELADDLTQATPKTLQTFKDTAGAQFYGFDLTPLPDNHFALVWAEHYEPQQADAGEPAPASTADRIVLQRYDGQGDKVGDERVIAVLENGRFPWQPSVSADLDGNMVVAWGESAQGASITGRVNKYCDSTELDADVEVKARLISQSGQPSDVIQPGLAASAQPCAIDTAMDEDGDFALLWALKEDNNQFSGRTNLQIQTFNALGQNQTSPVSIINHTLLTGDLAFYANNALIVAYVVIADDGSSSRVMGQRYDLQGQVVGDAFHLANGIAASDVLLDSEVRPTLAVNPNDRERFIASWVVDSDPSVERISLGTAPQIKAQRWLADASPSMESVTVLSDVYIVSGAVSTPSLSMDSDGHFISVWSMAGMAGTQHDSLPQILASGFSGENEPMSEAIPLKQGAEYLYVPYNEFQSVQVAMNDQAIMLAWLDDIDINKDTSKTLNAIFVPGLVAVHPDPATDPQAATSGGSLSWLFGGFVAVLGLRRGWSRRLGARH